MRAGLCLNTSTNDAARSLAISVKPSVVLSQHAVRCVQHVVGAWAHAVGQGPCAAQARCHPARAAHIASKPEVV